MNDSPWLSPIDTEREWQESVIKLLFPSYPNSSPNWQTLNGLILLACDREITCEMLEELGFREEGEEPITEAPIYTNETLCLIQVYDKCTNRFHWVDDKTGKVFKTLTELIQKS